MEKLCEIMDKIVECIGTQFDSGLDNVDTKEMGEVVDILKDMYMIKYYHALIEKQGESAI